MQGFQHQGTGVWLNNDFQSPHFANINKLIAACYPSEQAFTDIHGDPNDWKKRTITEEEIALLFSGEGES